MKLELKRLPPHHLPPACDGRMHVHQRAAVLLKHLRGPQGAVHVSPLVLAQVQETARILREHSKAEKGRWESLGAPPRSFSPHEHRYAFVLGILFSNLTLDAADQV